VMDEVAPPRDSQKADRAGPRCGGGNLGQSPSKETQEGPGGGPSCVFWAERKLRFRRVLGTALCAERMRAEPACFLVGGRLVWGACGRCLRHGAQGRRCVCRFLF